MTFLHRAAQLAALSAAVLLVGCASPARMKGWSSTRRIRRRSGGAGVVGVAASGGFFFFLGELMSGPSEFRQSGSEKIEIRN